MTQPSVEFHDLADLRAEQAKLLNRGAKSSAIPVLFVIVNSSILLLLTGHGTPTFIWTGLALLMVGATLIYPRLNPVFTITRERAPRYLFGHVAITAVTGLVWAFCCLFLLDVTSRVSLTVCLLAPCSITLGGLFPSSIYRPAYIALAATALLPVAIYLIFADDWAVTFSGIGILAYFGFGMFSSAKTEVAMRDTLIARLQNSAFETISEKNKQVESLLEENTRFIAAISHDLVQPIRAATNFVTLLKQTKLTPSQAELIDKLNMTLQSQGVLWKDLLERSTLDKYELTPSIEHLKLADLLAATTSEFEALAHMRGISFDEKLGDYHVHCDATMLDRIVRNLLSNAVKYTQPGGWVKLAAEMKDDKIVLSVSDNGPGIPEEQQTRVFEEKVRLQATRNQPGLGLGLHIAKSLAEALGAPIMLQSKPGAGTSVLLTLANAENAEPENLQTVLVIGNAQHKIYGEWMPMLSSWKMRAVQARNLKEAGQLIDLLGETPQVIFVSAECFEENEYPWDDLARLSEGFNAAPMLYLETVTKIPEYFSDRMAQAKVPVEVSNTPIKAAELRLLFNSHASQQ